MLLLFCLKIRLWLMFCLWFCLWLLFLFVFSRCLFLLGLFCFQFGLCLSFLLFLRWFLINPCHWKELVLWLDDRFWKRFISKWFMFLGVIAREESPVHPLCTSFFNSLLKNNLRIESLYKRYKELLRAKVGTWIPILFESDATVHQGPTTKWRRCLVEIVHLAGVFGDDIVLVGLVLHILSKLHNVVHNRSDVREHLRLEFAEKNNSIH